jgi:hypothetical protein
MVRIDKGLPLTVMPESRGTVAVGDFTGGATFAGNARNKVHVALTQLIDMLHRYIYQSAVDPCRQSVLRGNGEHKIALGDIGKRVIFLQLQRAVLAFVSLRKCPGGDFHNALRSVS